MKFCNVCGIEIDTRGRRNSPAAPARPPLVVGHLPIVPACLPARLVRQPRHPTSSAGRASVGALTPQLADPLRHASKTPFSEHPRAVGPQFRQVATCCNIAGFRP